MKEDEPVISTPKATGEKSVKELSWLNSLVIKDVDLQSDTSGLIEDEDCIIVPSKRKQMLQAQKKLQNPT